MEKVCTSPECPVHFRNDVVGLGEHEFPYMISYVGNWAVFTDTGLRRSITPEDSPKLAAEAVLLMLSGASEETFQEFFGRVFEGFTFVYEVGNGAISDCESYETQGVEQYWGKPEEAEDRHRTAVEMVKLRQEV